LCATIGKQGEGASSIDKDIGMELGHIQAASWVASQIGFTSSGEWREHDLIERLISEFKQKLHFALQKNGFVR